MDRSNRLPEHIQSVKTMLDKCDIVMRHQRCIRKEDRNMITKEICSRPDIKEMNVNAITYFQTKHNKSIYVILKQLQKQERMYPNCIK